MSRTVPEWIGKNDDVPPPPRVRLRVLEKYNCLCQCGCFRKIAIGEKWELDHIVALINGGQHKESNLHPVLEAHHKQKSREDVALKSKNYSRRSSHFGVKRKPKGRPMLGTRASGLRKKFDGTVERR